MKVWIRSDINNKFFVMLFTNTKDIRNGYQPESTYAVHR